MKELVSKGEQNFIRGCTKAILTNDVDQYHWLFKVNGVKVYYVHKEPQAADHHRIFKSAICICSIGPEFITDWHYKAGHDDLSKAWINRGLKDLIEHSESFADFIYSPSSKHKNDKTIRTITTPGLTEAGRTEYFNKITRLLNPKK
ncbi:hypothetical protein QUF84_14910 [Fictibacillus enclensis]|uniref:hypothetical protein n=1 Tax=Fictibacillus enclensis TaxID=1017270 RepID=UPI0025A27148|nr:hypothetical protein [Fictibacillus enclensis]MDM5338501.1 hypothetical protein [Fictibacillus enclensis]